MRWKGMIWAAAFAAASLFTGCAETGRLDMDYGTSYKLAKYNQILNPEAEKNLEPVYGMDGEVAARVTEKHRKGFEKVEPKASFIVDVGKTAR